MNASGNGHFHLNIRKGIVEFVPKSLVITRDVGVVLEVETYIRIQVLRWEIPQEDNHDLSISVFEHRVMS